MSEKSTKPAICFICQHAAGAVAGDKRGHVGGAERQAATIARWLAAKGYPISFITWDEGHDEGQIHGDITLYRLCRVDKGLRGLRFLHPRSTSLVSAMRRANADVYVNTPADYFTGLAALVCRMSGRRFIYSVAANPDCMAALPHLRRWHDRVLYRWGLRHADRVVAQTVYQQQLLRKSFAVDSVVVPMPSSFPVQHDASFPTGRPRVAWVGRVDPVKRLEWLLDMAAQMPEVDFDVITPNLESALADSVRASYTRGLLERGKLLANVAWPGRVSDERLKQIYQQAVCLCCTSSSEGFPNTFLEAWSCGRPVVSSFDPDDLIASRQLGFFGRSVGELADAVRKLSRSPDLWAEQSARCRNYFSDTHAIEAAMPRFEHAFLSVLDPPRGCGLEASQPHYQSNL